ncbi:hypothetical protein [Herbaspirillum camelliae]|uniref:hypothetical protein n=1 Tax=Herbaspirillum camelliae TaxID=1892903 RepID=UPI000A4FF203|nr:hypothetical protein [Herbaspirillum camelliae]
MRTQTVALIMAVVFFGMIQTSSAAGVVLLRYGSSPVTLTGTLDTDATRHLYLRLDQPISVAADRPANPASTDLINQREVDVHGFVSNQPIRDVRITLTGVLSPSPGDARPIVLEVR